MSHISAERFRLSQYLPNINVAHAGSAHTEEKAASRISRFLVLNLRSSQCHIQNHHHYKAQSEGDGADIGVLAL